MITYKWIISSMDCKLVEGSLIDVVITCHWRRSGQTADYDPTTETGYYVDVYGALTLENPDPTDFIPYADLTQADVEVWLNEMTEPNPTELDENLADQIALLKNPVDATLPLPWTE